MLRAASDLAVARPARFPRYNGTHDDCEITRTAVHGFFGNIGMHDTRDVAEIIDKEDDKKLIDVPSVLVIQVTSN